MALILPTASSEVLFRFRESAPLDPIVETRVFFIRSPLVSTGGRIVHFNSVMTPWHSMGSAHREVEVSGEEDLPTRDVDTAEVCQRAR